MPPTEFSNPFRFLHARELQRLSRKSLERYALAGFRYWRSRGFPFPSLTNEEKRSAYQTLQQSEKRVFLKNREVQWSPVGIGLANSFHPQMWSTKCEGFRTAIEVFEDDAMLRDCIATALNLCIDRRPLNPNNIRGMTSTYKNTKRVSNFRPTVARAVYMRYSRPGETIVDPAAGYGGRLLGCLPLNRRYIGIEPASENYRGLNKMDQALSRIVKVKATTTLIKGCAEDVLQNLEKESVALAIFSPPYFARERYSNETTQSYRRYEIYAEWKRFFLEAVIAQVHRILKKGGYLVVNVANTEKRPIFDDLKSIVRRYMAFHYSYKMRIGNVPYHRTKNGGHRHEPLLVFKK